MAGKPINTDFLKRALSGAVFVVVVAACTLLSPWTFGALLSIVAAGCLWEFYRMAAAAGAEPQRGFGMALWLALLTAGWVGALTGLRFTAPVAMAALPCVLTVFIAELYRKREKPLLNVTATLAGGIYVAAPLLLFLVMTTGPGAGASSYRPWEAMSLLLVVWANDTGAYLVGMAFGRRRLMERVSPKKSWEGFFGGVAVAAGVAWLCARFAGLSGAESLVWLGAGVVVAVTGVLGDLVESMFKRSAGIKDSGSIMPGHGGWLDRFDALLIAIPFACFYFMLFNRL